MVSREEIKHLGWLSKLELTEEEISKYTLQIEEIIGYLNKLDNISLSHIESVRSRKNISELRKDRVEPFKADPLEGSKNKKDGFIKGPRLS
ncbi:MAG TPA: Asp-tRNA(Asn)/Glu-tRNA(Gln) amidotransferase subunit GatC [Nitrososphaeraceae archaeon]|jgi:aspartyl-tRNA(Asn)/glutamyl-tRNA(Gln) amidotransferase subunit C|nr:Asp-tRNA(Asn)/Glu-tRNA(Gln) amidotransferase subunit GatC [Nitrososphaeraceae archaeon]